MSNQLPYDESLDDVKLVSETFISLISVELSSCVFT